MPQVETKTIARLARLSPAAGVGLEEDLRSMVRFASRLRGDEDAPPAAREANVLREDRPAPCLEREKLLASAPDAREGCFWVPQGALGEDAQ